MCESAWRKLPTNCSFVRGLPIKGYPRKAVKMWLSQEERDNPYGSLKDREFDRLADRVAQGSVNPDYYFWLELDRRNNGSG